MYVMGKESRLFRMSEIHGTYNKIWQAVCICTYGILWEFPKRDLYFDYTSRTMEATISYSANIFLQFASDGYVCGLTFTLVVFENENECVVPSVIFWENALTKFYIIYKYV